MDLMKCIFNEHKNQGKMFDKLTFLNLQLMEYKIRLPYFIEYNVHTIECAPEFHNDFWQKNNFYFSRIISKELIIASVFLTNAILKPFSTTFHV